MTTMKNGLANDRRLIEPREHRAGELRSHEYHEDVDEE
jgi:hypothetical protein